MSGLKEVGAKDNGVQGYWGARLVGENGQGLLGVQG